MSDPPINLDELRELASRGGRAIDGGAAFTAIRDNHLFALVEAVKALRPIIREYDLWAEDANDGEFRLWDLDRLVMAIVNARAALARFAPPRQEGDAT